jgi:hypothetical protein
MIYSEASDNRHNPHHNQPDPLLEWIMAQIESEQNEQV